MTAQVDAVVYFRVQDPVASVVQAENAKNSTYRVAQGTLRDVLGTKSLAEILSDREEISEHMGVSVNSMFYGSTGLHTPFSSCYWTRPLTAGESKY